MTEPKLFRRKVTYTTAAQYFADGPRIDGVMYEHSLDEGSGKMVPLPCVLTAHEQRAYLADGDWVIPEKQEGRFYPVKPDVFEATYEPANEGEPIAADEQAYHDEHIRFSIRNSALAFAIQNQGKGGNPKNLIVAAQTFAEFLEGAATDPVMPELKPTLKMQDGSEPPPHVARMIDEYLELDKRRKKLLCFIGDHPIFSKMTANEQDAMRDQLDAINDYYAALMRRLAYAGAMTS